MEGSAFSGLFQEMEDHTFINQWMVDDSYTSMPMEAAFLDADFHHSLLYDQHQLPIKPATVDDFHDRPVKQLKADSWGSSIIEPSPSPESNNNFSADAAAVSFFYPKENPTGILIKPRPDDSDYNLYDDDDDLPPQFTIERFDSPAAWNNESTHALKSGHGGKRKVSSMIASHRSPEAQDHVIAERKRREKLSQRFIALSAVVPGLKKMDKASVLADAIKYLKQLQDRVKTLEDQTKSKTIVSAVHVKKLQLVIDENGKPFCFDEAPQPNDQQFPEIEARVQDKDVLIRVHCEKKKGVIENIFCEISKLHHLTVVNTSVLAFGTSALDLTIIAQADAGRPMTVKELVKTLGMGFMSFM